jgi:cyclic pyranopterin phosphate synthase
LWRSGPSRAFEIAAAVLLLKQHERSFQWGVLHFPDATPAGTLSFRMVPRRPIEGRSRREHALTHVARDADGLRSRMVDVGSKPVRARSALARARIVFPPGALRTVLAARGPKGAVEDVARAAGLIAAKRTSELIPMCHSLGLDHVEIRFEADGLNVLEVRCRAACRGRTGVEMEALVGAAVAALTVYDMTKALDHGIRIADVELLEKRGGRSGVWKRGIQDKGSRATSSSATRVEKSVRAPDSARGHSRGEREGNRRPDRNRRKDR